MAGGFGAVQAQTASLTLDPNEIQADSLDGATIIVTPMNASFLGIGAGTGGEGGVGADLLAGQPGDSERAFTAAGLAKIKLSNAPVGLTISSGKVLAPQTDVHGMTKHRSAEFILDYSGSSITSDNTVTVTVLGSTNNRDGLLRIQGRGELPDLSAPFTIKAGTAQSTITITRDGASVTEGTGADFTVMANPAPSTPLTVNLSVSERTADGQDFVADGDEGSNKTVTINANQTTAGYTVPTVSDMVDEPDGRVTVRVDSGTDYTVGSSSTAMVTIIDDDEPPPGTPVVRITGGGTITEGGTAIYTLSADPAPPNQITVTV